MSSRNTATRRFGHSFRLPCRQTRVSGSMACSRFWNGEPGGRATRRARVRPAGLRKEAVLSSQIEGTQSSLSDLLMFVRTEPAPHRDHGQARGLRSERVSLHAASAGRYHSRHGAKNRHVGAHRGEVARSHANHGNRTRDHRARTRPDIRVRGLSGDLK